MAGHSAPCRGRDLNFQVIIKNKLRLNRIKMMRLWHISLAVGIILLIIGAQSFYVNLVYGGPGIEIWGLLIGPMLIVASIFLKKKLR